MASTDTDPGLAAVAHVEQALALRSGELLLSNPYAPWAVRERESLGRLTTTVCAVAAKLANDAGESVRAVRLARMATEQAIFSEAAWQELMRALWSTGRRSEALRAYADLRAGMLDELGIEPSPVSQRLYMTVLHGAPVRPGASQERREVRTLLRLLRQALECSPARDVADEPGLSEVARVLLRHPA